MPDIFLSYAREDLARAEQVAEALTRDGYDVFWDREIPPGVAWADHLEAMLTGCKALVVLWSVSSTPSRWVREEARMARDRGKLVPAMLDGSAPPFGFGEVQAADLTNWQGDPQDPDWERLRAGIARLTSDAAREGPPAPQARPSPSAPAPQRAASGGRGSPWAQARLIGSVGVVGIVVWMAAVLAHLDTRLALPTPSAELAQYNAAAWASMSPAVHAMSETARRTAEQASTAGTTAMNESVLAHQAARKAQSGQPGFGTRRLSMGEVTGDIVALQALKPAAVTISAGPEFRASGRLHLQDRGIDTYAISGVVEVTGGPTAEGHWQHTGDRYEFVGRANAPGRFTAWVREAGGDTVGTAGIGVISYADGERYEGQYRSEGELQNLVTFRHGLGVLHDRQGRIKAHGRFEEDVWVGMH